MGFLIAGSFRVIQNQARAIIVAVSSFYTRWFTIREYKLVKKFLDGDQIRRVSSWYKVEYVCEAKVREIEWAMQGEDS